MPARTALTYADYATLPADGRRYELHDGELSVTPAPGTRHQRALIRLGAALHDHVVAHGLGEVLVAPTDCILSDRTVVQPDIIFIARDRASLVTDRAVEGPPTLVVEVLAPSTTAIDLGAKRDLYARHLVPFYWIVDTDARTIAALRLVDGTFQPVGQLALTIPAALPPLERLTLDPSAIWP